MTSSALTLLLTGNELPAEIYQAENPLPPLSPRNWHGYSSYRKTKANEGTSASTT